MAKFWLSKSIFFVKNHTNLFKKIFIENYNFAGTLFVIGIFLKLHFLPLYFLKWRPIFEDFYSTERKTQKLFKGLVVGFGPKGMPARTCNIVRYKWGHTCIR